MPQKHPPASTAVSSSCVLCGRFRRGRRNGHGGLGLRRKRRGGERKREEEGGAFHHGGLPVNTFAVIYG